MFKSSITEQPEARVGRGDMAMERLVRGISLGGELEMKYSK